jgi:DNA-binding transcriptional MerR regulator
MSVMRRHSVSKRTLRKTARNVLMSRAALRVLAGVTDAELTIWEHEELIVPVEPADHFGEPLYTSAALRRARLIRTLAEELDVNLPGIGVILHLLDQMEH